MIYIRVPDGDCEKDNDCSLTHFFLNLKIIERFENTIHTRAQHTYVQTQQHQHIHICISHPLFYIDDGCITGIDAE
jgi:hypothetical protein